MTDNEKRAHDIAIALLPEYLQNAIQKAAITGDISDGIDIYVLYQKTYDSALKNLNRDYPGQK